jgi:hypothetical protein
MGDVEVDHRSLEGPPQTKPDRQDHLRAARRGDVAKVDDVLPPEFLK